MASRPDYPAQGRGHKGNSYVVIAAIKARLRGSRAARAPRRPELRRRPRVVALRRGTRAGATGRPRRAGSRWASAARKCKSRRAVKSRRRRGRNAGTPSADIPSRAARSFSRPRASGSRSISRMTIRSPGRSRCSACRNRSAAAQRGQPARVKTSMSGGDAAKLLETTSATTRAKQPNTLRVVGGMTSARRGRRNGRDQARSNV